MVACYGVTVFERHLTIDVDIDEAFCRETFWIERAKWDLHDCLSGWILLLVVLGMFCQMLQWWLKKKRQQQNLNQKLSVGNTK